jgi:hypothetical protein
MNQRVFLPTASSLVPGDLPPLPSEQCELSEQESAEAFKVILTLREAIEAADSVERRLEGTNDRRYATFLTKARERHLQTAETARNLLIEMIVSMSGDAAPAKGSPELVRRSG